MRQTLQILILLTIFLGVTENGLHSSPVQRKGEGYTFYTISGMRVSSDSDVAALRRFVGEMTTTPEKPAFVVALGNLTEAGRTAEFNRFTEIMAPLQTAKVGLYSVPGKNDVIWSPMGKEGYAKAVGKTYQSFDLEGVHYVLLDSTVIQSGYGHFDKEQLEWLERDIKKQKPETPIIVFVYHHVGRATPSTRVIDNEYDMLRRLHGKNVVAIFTGDGQADQDWQTNSIPTLASRSLAQGTYHKITVTPALITIERIVANREGKPYRITAPITRRVQFSRIRAGWDDPDIPFLERRRPAVTLEPRALSDTPDGETAEYRIDDGAWKQMTKDARDIWRDTFLTKPLSIGIHTAEVRINTSTKGRLTEELIFEVERSNTEPTRKWALDLEGPIQSNPLLDKNLLYVSALDGKVYALNITTGKQKWKFSTKNALQASPILSDGTLFIGSTDNFLYALDAENGKQKWKYDAGTPILSTAAVAKGVVCVGVHRKVVGVNTSTGKETWSRPLEGCYLSNVVTDGSIFYLVGIDNRLYAMDATTGNTIWTKKLGKNPDNPTFVANPLLLGDRLYLISGDNTLYAINPQNGDVVWNVIAPRGSDPFGAFKPAAVGDTLFVNGSGKNGDVYALNKSNGNVRWKASLGQPIYNSSPRVAPDGASLAVMTFRGKVVVLNATNGKLLWSYELGPGNIFSTPEYDGTVVYTTTMANDVQGLAAPSSNPIRGGAK